MHLRKILLAYISSSLKRRFWHSCFVANQSVPKQARRKKATEHHGMFRQQRRILVRIKSQFGVHMPRNLLTSPLETAESQLHKAAVCLQTV